LRNILGGLVIRLTKQHMEEKNFDIDWLAKRYPFDVEARNKTVEQKAIDYLKKDQPLVIVDLGAGTGSNCLYFLDKLKQDQSWIFIEKDPQLAPALIHRLEEYATFHKYKWSYINGVYEMLTPFKKVTFKVISDTFFKIDQLVDLSKVDLVVANAVFDLLSKVQISQFLDQLTSNKIACLFTLHYTGMRFKPEDPFDQAYIDLYDEHMVRPQSFGQAMGKLAAAHVAQTLEDANYTLEKGESTWNIKEDDIKMHYYLLNFMDNALSELQYTDELQAYFPKWFQRKKDLIITRKQSLEVKHIDLFACSSKEKVVDK